MKKYIPVTPKEESLEVKKANLNNKIYCKPSIIVLSFIERGFSWLAWNHIYTCCLKLERKLRIIVMV